MNKIVEAALSVAIDCSVKVVMKTTIFKDKDKDKDKKIHIIYPP